VSSNQHENRPVEQADVPREPFPVGDAVALDEDRVEVTHPDEQRDRSALHLGEEMELRGERLVGSAEQHEWARVRVTRRIVTREETITVPVRREELVIEYLDEMAPKAHPGTVRGSTQAVDSRVEHEVVLHQEVPRVVVDVVPYEKVQFLVDTQRSLVEFTDDLRREQLTIHQDGRELRDHDGDLGRAPEAGRSLDA